MTLACWPGPVHESFEILDFVFVVSEAEKTRDLGSWYELPFSPNQLAAIYLRILARVAERYLENNLTAYLEQSIC